MQQAILRTAIHQCNRDEAAHLEQEFESAAVDASLKTYPQYKPSPMNAEVVMTAEEITDIPELHDRLIAATARLLGCSLLTNDPAIQASSFVKTIW